MFTNRFTKIVLIVLIAAAALVSVSFAARSNNSPVADRSYDTVEQIRGSLLGPGYALHLAADSSQDRIEQLRLERSWKAAADRSYDAIESLRLQRCAK